MCPGVTPLHGEGEFDSLASPMLNLMFQVDFTLVTVKDQMCVCSGAIGLTARQSYPTNMTLKQSKLVHLHEFFCLKGEGEKPGKHSRVC